MAEKGYRLLQPLVRFRSICSAPFFGGRQEHAVTLKDAWLTESYGFEGRCLSSLGSFVAFDTGSSEEEFCNDHSLAERKGFDMADGLKKQTNSEHDEASYVDLPKASCSIEPVRTLRHLVARS